MQLTLVDGRHGFSDFDVSGIPAVHRVAIPHKIKPGEVFNVYCADCVKLGATWEGSPEKSLRKFMNRHPLYRRLPDVVAAYVVAIREGRD